MVNCRSAYFLCFLETSCQWIERELRQRSYATLPSVPTLPAQRRKGEGKKNTPKEVERAAYSAEAPACSWSEWCGPLVLLVDDQLSYREGRHNYRAATGARKGTSEFLATATTPTHFWAPGSDSPIAPADAPSTGQCFSLSSHQPLATRYHLNSDGRLRHELIPTAALERLDSQNFRYFA